MKLPRRQILHLAAGAAVLPTMSRIATAQTYPTRPITMIVPFPAGGPTDAVGRVVAERMRKSLGQPLIIENVGGAEGTIGVLRAVRAKPDGYAIHIGLLPTHVLNAVLYSLPYDLLHDIAPIAPLVSFPAIVFTRKSLPQRTLGELIAWLRENPNKASAGVDTSGIQVITTLFQKVTGTQFILVPYRGAAPAMQDLVAGQIDLFFNSPAHLPLVRAGNIKALAVTSDVRLSSLPDVPTLRELGFPALSYRSWYSLFAPGKTPKDIIGRLNSAAVDALSDAAVRDRLVDLGMEVFERERQTPEALAAMQKADAEKWWPLIKEFGIKAQ